MYFVLVAENTKTQGKKITILHNNINLKTACKVKKKSGTKEYILCDSIFME
jgi:hypothetical protein